MTMMTNPEDVPPAVGRAALELATSTFDQVLRDNGYHLPWDALLDTLERELARAYAEMNAGLDVEAEPVN